MDVNEIKLLLGKFYKGETTSDEELNLRNYFCGDDVDACLSEEKEFFIACQKAFCPPDIDKDTFTSLNKNLSKHIDQWNMIEKVSQRKARTISLRWIAGVAASLLIIFFFSFYINNYHQKTEQAKQNTYSNPQDAYAETQRALMKFSLSLNNGLDKVNKINN